MSSGLVRCSQTFVTGAFSVAETLAAIASFSFSLVATASLINAFCLLAMLGRKLRGEVLRFEHLPNLDFRLFTRHGIGAALDPIDCLLQRFALPNPKTGHQLLGFGKRTVNKGALIPRELNSSNLRTRLQSLSGGHNDGSGTFLVAFTC